MECFAKFRWEVDTSHYLNGPFQALKVALESFRTPTVDLEAFRISIKAILEINKAKDEYPFSGGADTLLVCLTLGINDSLCGYEITGDWKTHNYDQMIKCLRNDFNLVLNEHQNRVLQSLFCTNFILEERHAYNTKRERNKFDSDPLVLMKVPMEELWRNDKDNAVCRTHVIHVAALWMISPPALWHVSAIYLCPQEIRKTFFFGFMKKGTRVGEALHHLECGMYGEGMVLRRPPFTKVSRGFAQMITFGQFAFALASGCIKLDDIQNSCAGQGSGPQDLFTFRESMDSPIRVPSFCWAALSREWITYSSGVEANFTCPEEVAIVLTKSLLTFWRKCRQVLYDASLSNEELNKCMLFPEMSQKDDNIEYEKLFTTAVADAESNSQNILRERERMLGLPETPKSLIFDRSHEVSLANSSCFSDKLDFVRDALQDYDEKDYPILNAIVSKGQYFGCCEDLSHINTLYNLPFRLPLALSFEESTTLTLRDLANRFDSPEEELVKIEMGLKGFNKWVAGRKQIPAGECGEVHQSYFALQQLSMEDPIISILSTSDWESGESDHLWRCLRDTAVNIYDPLTKCYGNMETKFKSWNSIPNHFKRVVQVFDRQFKRFMSPTLSLPDLEFNLKNKRVAPMKVSEIEKQRKEYKFRRVFKKISENPLSIEEDILTKTIKSLNHGFYQEIPSNSRQSIENTCRSLTESEMKNCVGTLQIVGKVFEDRYTSMDMDKSIKESIRQYSSVCEDLGEQIRLSDSCNGIMFIINVEISSGCLRNLARMIKTILSERWFDYVGIAPEICNPIDNKTILPKKLDLIDYETTHSWYLISKYCFDYIRKILESKDCDQWNMITLVDIANEYDTEEAFTSAESVSESQLQEFIKLLECYENSQCLAIMLKIQARLYELQTLHDYDPSSSNALFSMNFGTSNNEKLFDFKSIWDDAPISNTEETTTTTNEWNNIFGSAAASNDTSVAASVFNTSSFNTNAASSNIGNGGNSSSIDWNYESMFNMD